MRWLIFALGVALALGGAASIVLGSPYIRMESGWTEVIAGTTALSAGIMTVALAAILSALRRLEPRFVQNNPSTSHDGAEIGLAAEPILSTEIAADPVGDGPDVASPESDVPVPSVVERDIPPLPAARSLEERIWSGPSTLGTASERAKPAVPLESYRSMDRSSGVRPAPVLARDRDARRRPESGDLGGAVPRSYARSGLASPDRTDADDRVPSLIPSPRPSNTAAAGPVSTLTESPTVVGRYESGGASYVLFSDGTIEVETEIGTHSFASMAELKAYIDQQDKASLG